MNNKEKLIMDKGINLLNKLFDNLVGQIYNIDNKATIKLFNFLFKENLKVFKKLSGDKNINIQDRSNYWNHYLKLYDLYKKFELERDTINFYEIVR